MVFGKASMLIQPQGVIQNPGEAWFLNPSLLALNVFEIDIASDMLNELMPLAAETRTMEQHPGRFTLSNGVELYNERPRHWRSDIRWLSHADEPSYFWFESIFNRMGLAEKVAPFVRHDRDIRLYAGFFVTRSQCEALDMHCDWATEETDAFTLMAPLRPNGSDLGMTYDTVRGTRRTLTYRLGKGLVFGPKFFHSTAVGKLDERAVFLCFNFGTDRMENWPTISKTVAMQCDLVRQPDGSFIRHAEWRSIHGKPSVY